MSQPNSTALFRILLARRLGRAVSADAPPPEIGKEDVETLARLLEEKAASFKPVPDQLVRQILYDGTLYDATAPKAGSMVNWFDGREGNVTIPQFRLRPLLHEVLRDVDPAMQTEQDALLAQLIDAWKEDSRKSEGDGAMSAPPDAAPKTPDGPAPSKEWLVDRERFDAYLMDFAIEEPPQGASPETGFEVLPWIDGATRRAPDPAGCFDIGLRRFRVQYEAEGCQPSGQKFEDRPLCTIHGAGWLFEARPEEVLRGRLLAPTAELMRMRRSGSGDPKVRLTFECADEFDLVVVPRDGEPRTSEELRKVAQRYLQKCNWDPENGASFGWAELRWGVREA